MVKNRPRIAKNGIKWGEMIRIVKIEPTIVFSTPKNIYVPKIGHSKWINEEKKVDFNLFFIRNRKFTFSLVAEAGGGQILQNVIFCDLLDPTDHLKWDSDVPHEKSPIVPTLLKIILKWMNLKMIM